MVRYKNNLICQILYALMYVFALQPEIVNIHYSEIIIVNCNLI